MTPDLLLCATRTACRLCRCDGPTIEPKQMLFKTNTAGLTIKLIRYLVDATTLKGRIIVLFSDDSLRVWCLCDNDTNPVGSGAWQCVTHVRLIEQRDVRLQQNSARAITNAYRVSGAVTDQSRNAQFMEKLTTDYTKPLVGLAEFVGDNTLMLGMSDGYLMLVNVVDWTVEAVYSLPGIAFSGFRGFGGFGGNCDRRLNHANVIPIVLNKERLGFFEISDDNGQCRALGLMQRRDTVTAGQRSHNGKLLGVVANKGKTYIHDFTAILMGFKNRSNNIDCSMRERDVEKINKEVSAKQVPLIITFCEIFILFFLIGSCGQCSRRNACMRCLKRMANTRSSIVASFGSAFYCCRTTRRLSQCCWRKAPIRLWWASTTSFHSLMQRNGVVWRKFSPAWRTGVKYWANASVWLTPA